MPNRKRSPPATRRRRALEMRAGNRDGVPGRSCSRTDFRSSYLSSWFMPGSPRQALNARSPADTRSRLPACGSRTPVGEHSRDAPSDDHADPQSRVGFPPIRRSLTSPTRCARSWSASGRIWRTSCLPGSRRVAINRAAPRGVGKNAIASMQSFP